MPNKTMTIEELLKTEGKYVGPTFGVSMLPMLKTGRDSVVVRPKEGRLSPYDVALYKRGDDYVLHRVITVTDWGYIIRGDNCLGNERVREEQILGVLTEYFRGNKHVSLTDKKYVRYSRRIVRNYPIRRFFRLFRSRIRGLAKRILSIFFRRKK